jgi:hypothetical protein
MSSTTGPAIVALLESDVLTAAAGPLLAFLNSVNKNPSAMNVAAQWIQLQGALIGSLPELEIQAIQQISANLQTKLQALVAAKQAAPTVA